MKTRYYLIGNTMHMVVKSMFKGPKQYNAKGEWIYAYYTKPTVLEDTVANWTPIGRTLSDVRHWVRINNATPAGSKA